MFCSTEESRAGIVVNFFRVVNGELFLEIHSMSVCVEDQCFLQEEENDFLIWGVPFFVIGNG